MGRNGTVCWGILGTSQIVVDSFLPAVRATGAEVALTVGGRDPERTRGFAQANGIDNAAESYDAVVADPSVDAVYVPLPNSMHAEWTMKALEAGKAVLCEKPLCTSLRQTEEVLDVARRTHSLLWEGFVFPFRPQFSRLQAIIGSGEIGRLVEIQANFHFHMDHRNNIRLSPQLGGGALNDVGCYPVHLSGLLVDAPPRAAVAIATPAPEGVDEAMRGTISYENGATLQFSCGMMEYADTFSRVLGSEGEIRIASPYHPSAIDALDIRVGDLSRTEHPTGPEPSFTLALEHIHAVLREDAAPRHLALSDSLQTARAMQLARDAARQSDS